MLSISSLFKCLSDDTRLNSTLLIQRETELCVCELMAALDISQPKVSRHLAQLKACGILLDERRGQWVYYSIHPSLPSWAKKILILSDETNKKEVDSLQKRLSSMDRRPLSC